MADPAIDIPERVTFGELEVGATATAQFSVRNNGRADLLIDNIRTTCSCSGLERDEDGQFVPVSSLRVATGQRAALAVRLVVNGRPGEPLITRVSFDTNDPLRPRVEMELLVTKVTGGVRAEPTSLEFGTLPAGQSVRRVIDIRDGAATPRPVERVVTTDTKHMTVRLLPGSHTPKGGAPGQGREARLVARVEVVVRREDAGAVAGEVRVLLAGEEHAPLVIPVTARFAPPVEAYPASVSLPRASGKGALYFADCLCRSLNGKPLSLTLVSAPPGVSARIDEKKGGPNTRVVQIAWDRTTAASLKPIVGSVQFRASTGGEQCIVTIPVRVNTEDR